MGIQNVYYDIESPNFSNYGQYRGVFTVYDPIINDDGYTCDILCISQLQHKGTISNPNISVRFGYAGNIDSQSFLSATVQSDDWVNVGEPIEQTVTVNMFGHNLYNTIVYEDYCTIRCLLEDKYPDSSSIWIGASKDSRVNYPFTKQQTNSPIINNLNIMRSSVSTLIPKRSEEGRFLFASFDWEIDNIEYNGIKNIAEVTTWVDDNNTAALVRSLAGLITTISINGESITTEYNISNIHPNENLIYGVSGNSTRSYADYDAAGWRIPFDTNKELYYHIRIRDLLGANTLEKTSVIPRSFFTLDFNPVSKGFGLGSAAPEEGMAIGTRDGGFDTKIEGPTTIEYNLYSEIEENSELYNSLIVLNWTDVIN